MNNPTAAGQVAASVTMTYMMIFKEEANQQQQTVSIFDILRAAAMAQRDQDNGEDSETE